MAKVAGSGGAGAAAPKRRRPTGRGGIGAYPKTAKPKSVGFHDVPAAGAKPKTTKQKPKSKKALTPDQLFQQMKKKEAAEYNAGIRKVKPPPAKTQGATDWEKGENWMDQAWGGLSDAVDKIQDKLKKIGR